MSYSAMQDEIKSKTDIEALQKCLFNYDSYGQMNFAVDIFRFTKRTKRQKVSFILTDDSLYTIKRKGFRGKLAVLDALALSDIASITTSAISGEFTLHIPSTFDIRFDTRNHALQSRIISHISVLKSDAFFVSNIDDYSTYKWTVTEKRVKQMSECREEILCAVFGLDFLLNIGFKSKTAQIALQKNGYNLSRTLCALINDFLKDSKTSKTGHGRFRSPFLSADVTPNIAQIAPSNAGKQSTAFLHLEQEYSLGSMSGTPSMSGTASFCVHELNGMKCAYVR